MSHWDENSTAAIEADRERLAKQVLALQKADRKLRRQYTKHVKFVAAFIDALDKVMREPSTPDLGRRVAELSDKLEFGNDTCGHFDLGMKLKKKKH
jgi:phage shock protein A